MCVYECGHASECVDVCVHVYEYMSKSVTERERERERESMNINSGQNARLFALETMSEYKTSYSCRI